MLMFGYELVEYYCYLYEEEFVYVLFGIGVVMIGEYVSEIGFGDFIGFLCGGDVYMVQNIGDVLLELFVGGQWFEYDVCEYLCIGKWFYIVGEFEEYVELLKQL